MKNLKKLTGLLHLMAICVLILFTQESKAQVKKMSAKDLTEKSTAVFYGKCTNRRCEWNDKKSLIYTYVTIKAEEYIKGNLGSEVVVAVPGGRVDDIIYEVSETPFFTEDEEVVAFIWTNPAGKNLVTGGFQGKLSIEKDEKTGKRTVSDNSSDEEVVVNQGFEQATNPKKISLDDFVLKLKGYSRN